MTALHEVRPAPGETYAPGASAPPAGAPAAPFGIGPRVTRAVRGLAHERRPGDPACRPLRVFAADPTTPRGDGAVAVIEVPYEPVTPGPVGKLFAVDAGDGRCHRSYAPLDLDEPGVMLKDGHDPSSTDPRFHQQMVYAVCSAVYATFRRALGRHVAWGFDGEGATPGAPGRLTLRPFANGDRNAYYDRAEGTLCFGYFEAPADARGFNPPGSFVFTSLSHDVVAHEVTHALLDGLRAHFARPTGPDVPAFHEGFADLVALFHRFSYPDVLRAALRRASGDLTRDSLLTDIARQLGDTTGAGRALRSAVDQVGAREPLAYDPSLPPHALGGVLVAAVFEAFAVVFRRKVARYVRIAGGMATAPGSELGTDLLELLVERCGRLARQFLNLCVRAIDYCPPVDLELGDFLRAVITADQELVPDDPWRYREALIHAFGRRRVFPRHVVSLTEDALRWASPQRPLPPIPALSFGRLQFNGDPARPADEDELLRQARALGEVVVQPAWRAEFGLLPASADADPPCVESVRSSRRVGPDGQVVFDLVAEVTQRRTARLADGRAFDFYGGATIVLGPEGEVRYVVRKRADHAGREAEQGAYARGDRSGMWGEVDDWLRPSRQPFRMLHAHP